MKFECTSDNATKVRYFEKYVQSRLSLYRLSIKQVLLRGEEKLITYSYNVLMIYFSTYM